VRPTADRVREALFARLGPLHEARVLDLYAGSGALGIEAISRGAASVVFVERAPRSLAALRENLASLGLGDRARVQPGDAARVIRRLAAEGARFDLVLLDPPYASGEIARALGALRRAGLLAPGATLVIESGRRHPLPAVAGFEVRDQRRYGDTLITRLAEEAAGGSRPV
jgi:16S rRNA (guanine(966)-N(2))-methyltransferase RsmD